MKPLREQLNDPSSTVRAAAVLLAQVPPLTLTTTQRRRIRAQVDATSEPGSRRWLRPALALPVLLVVGMAGASVSQGWLVPSRDKQLPEQASSTPGVARARAPKPPAVEAAPAQERETKLEVETSAGVEPKQAPPPQALRPAASSPGAQLMMEALQARRAGDSGRAQQLTAEYDRKYPKGPLREEALAIAFESAAARKDPAAARLAERYLASFPHGRFRQQAAQVLASRP